MSDSVLTIRKRLYEVFKQESPQLVKLMENLISRGETPYNIENYLTDRKVGTERKNTLVQVACYIHQTQNTHNQYDNRGNYTDASGKNYC